MLWNCCLKIFSKKKNARTTAAVAGQDNFAYWDYDQEHSKEASKEEEPSVEVIRIKYDSANDNKKEFKHSTNE